MPNAGFGDITVSSDPLAAFNATQNASNNDADFSQLTMLPTPDLVWPDFTVSPSASNATTSSTGTINSWWIIGGFGLLALVFLSGGSKRR